MEFKIYPASKNITEEKRIFLTVAAAQVQSRQVISRYIPEEKDIVIRHRSVDSR